MAGLVRDLKLALLLLVRAPGFAALAVVTLALGVGASTVMFSLVDGVLLQPLPLPESDRLILLREKDREGRSAWASYLNFADWRAGDRFFEAMAATTWPQTTTVSGATGPLRASFVQVTADYFRVAGLAPHRGKWIEPEQNRPGGPPVAVVGHGFWSRALGGPEDLRDLRLLVGDEVFDIVGVAPPGFSLVVEPDLWLPLDRAVPWTTRGNHVLPVVGRLPSDADPEAAKQGLDAIGRRIAEEHPGETTAVGVSMEPLKRWVIGNAWQPLRLLLAASGLLLLVACANVAIGLLARGIARRRELGIRASLGASRLRLLRQLLTESAVLATLGAVIGLGSASFVLRLLRHGASAALPRLDDVAMNPRTLLFTLGVTVLSTLLAGLLPAVAVLRRGGQLAPAVTAGRTHTDRRRPLVWRILIGAQITAALVLLTGAGLLVRSLWQITTSESGFDPRGVLTATLDVPHGDPATVVPQTYMAVVEALERIPGVEAAGFASHLPLHAGSFVGPIETDKGSDGPMAHYRIADAGYFQTLRIPLVRGRLFDRRDVAGSPHVVIVNSSLAARHWPGEDPIGQGIRLNGMDPYSEHAMTVVGVVEEARHWQRQPGSQLEYYVALPQRPALGRVLEVVVRSKGAATAVLAERVRETVRTAAPDASLTVAWLESRLAETTADRRLAAAVLTALAIVALVLAAAGIYSVFAYAVALRRREMGIRLALGAVPRQLVGSVLGEAARTLAAGLALGLLGALALTRVLSNQLFETSSLDPVVFAGAILGLALTGLLASWIPAARLHKIDPVKEIQAG